MSSIEAIYVFIIVDDTPDEVFLELFLQNSIFIRPVGSHGIRRPARIRLLRLKHFFYSERENKSSGKNAATLTLSIKSSAFARQGETPC